MNISQLNEKQLIASLVKCNNNSEISDFLHKSSISIEKLEPPFGSWRSEHLLKALNIADFFKLNDLSSEVPVLQTFFTMVKEDIRYNSSFNQQTYLEFYQAKFPNLQLTTSSWNQVLDKIKLETYIGIDKICEKSIILWNSLTGIRTTNSCSGHYDALRYFSFSNFNLQFDSDKVDIAHVAKLLKSVFSEFDTDIFKIDLEINHKQLGIRFFQIPPAKWIKENSKIAITELCDDLYIQLKATFNTDEDLGNFDFKNYDSTIDAVEFMRKNMWKYINQMNINQMNTNLKITDAEDESFWAIFRARCLIFEETYIEFYISKAAIDNINLFWEKIENVGNELRKIRLA